MPTITNINPNYQAFEEELKNHVLIREKIQEKINKRKFSTPITISKEKHPSEQQPTNEQISKAKEYDNLASIFPDGKIPSNLKEQWEALNKRPNITPEEYTKLKENQGALPTDLPTNWKEQLSSIESLNKQIKQLESDKTTLQQQITQLSNTNQITPEELKLLLKDNWNYLKGHIDTLTNIIKKAISSSLSVISTPSNTTSESKPSIPSSDENKPSSESKPKKQERTSQPTKRPEIVDDRSPRDKLKDEITKKAGDKRKKLPTWNIVEGEQKWGYYELNISTGEREFVEVESD